MYSWDSDRSRDYAVKSTTTTVRSTRITGPSWEAVRLSMPLALLWSRPALGTYQFTRKLSDIARDEPASKYGSALTTAAIRALLRPDVYPLDLASNSINLLRAETSERELFATDWVRRCNLRITLSTAKLRLHRQ